MKSNYSKIEEAKHNFEQWCDEDADQEIEIYKTKTGSSVDLETGGGADEFYLYLYDLGIANN